MCSGVPRFSRDGQFLGYLGTTVDVTDVKRALEADIARQKLESLGVLAGGVAHDFNNLLGGILGQAELMETELRVGSPLAAELRRIKTAAVRGSEIVRELMIYSGQDTKDFEAVDVSHLVREMLELLKVSISKRATLKIDLGESLPKVWGHAPQIRQVVMNLIINASEAIGEDQGVIEVRTSRVDSTKDVVPRSSMESSEGYYVLLEVSDTGRGVAEELRTRIFDPFFTTKFAGRRLGLAVVQGIVNSHHGAIDFSSNPGQGTTFHVYLPCAPTSLDSRDRIQDTLRGESTSVSGKSLLIVEDEESLRYSVARMLRMKGFSVLEAANGSAAIDLLRNRKYSFDMILLDLTLPGAPSRAIIDEVKRIRPDMKLVVMSAHSQESAEHSLKMQVSAFLRKPFQFNDLLRMLRTAMPS
jgi:nitrogen-specific signal transduction histidine kinase/CheY-like chemotaxis protein